ncbi:MAG: GspH/FimT family pseudopilin [Thermoanaerobaculia bacterium]
MCRPRSGATLLELLVVLAIMVVVAASSAPSFLRLSRALRLSMAANELVGVLRLARSSAIQSSSNIGVKFQVDKHGRVGFALYRDGDGDGVRTGDIESGVDPEVAANRTLAHLGGHVRFGFPAGIVPRDPSNPGRRLERLEDPIRFNRSDIAAFNSLGGSTPGSLYITDGRRLLVVRLFGRTGKVKVMRYEEGSATWE